MENLLNFVFGPAQASPSVGVCALEMGLGLSRVSWIPSLPEHLQGARPGQHPKAPVCALK